MALYQFEVLTPWVSHEDDPSPMPSNHPKLQDDYPHVFNPDGSVAQQGILKWEDTTGQSAENIVPDPNLYIIKCEADESVLHAIEADEQYEVLWSQEIIEPEVM